MPYTAEPIDILLRHNHWATSKVLDLCAGLTHEQFHRSFPIGPGERGGLHAAVLHILHAMRRWEDALAGRPARPTVERRDGDEPSVYRERSVGELRELLEESTGALRVLAGQGTHGDPIEIRFGDRAYTFSRGAGLLQALTHGHYHRAQCINMLRQLGVPGISDRLPELDVVDWQYECEKP
jgi:uncharacterized damage-inducible protein DinB